MFVLPIPWRDRIFILPKPQCESSCIFGGFVNCNIVRILCNTKRSHVRLGNNQHLLGCIVVCLMNVGICLCLIFVRWQCCFYLGKVSSAIGVILNQNIDCAQRGINVSQTEFEFDIWVIRVYRAQLNDIAVVNIGDLLNAIFGVACVIIIQRQIQAKQNLNINIDALNVLWIQQAVII